MFPCAIIYKCLLNILFIIRSFKLFTGFCHRLLLLPENLLLLKAIMIANKPAKMNVVQLVVVR